MKKIFKIHLKIVVQNGELIFPNKIKINQFFRIWDKWTFSDTSAFLMPDVSRIFRRPIDGNRINTKYIETLFNQKRKTSL
jgi:hypothetical protein